MTYMYVHASCYPQLCWSWFMEFAIDGAIMTGLAAAAEWADTSASAFMLLSPRRSLARKWSRARPRCWSWPRRCCRCRCWCYTRRIPQRQRLGNAARIVVVADGTTVRRRPTLHAIEQVGLRSVGVRRADDFPRGPVPALDQGLIEVAAGVYDVVTGGPAVRRRPARYTIEQVGLRSTGVGRADDFPRGPVPALDQGLKNTTRDGVVANGPAVRRRPARHA